MPITSILLAQIGVGWLFIRYLIGRDRGSKEPASGLWLAGLAGALAVVIAIYLNQRFVPAAILNDESVGSLSTLLSGALIIGLIEEGSKLLPLALVIYRKSYFNEVTDGIIYFGISGMVFGVAENIIYSLNYGDGVGYIRLLTVPFLHAGFCVWFGWLLARRKVLRTPAWTVVAGFAASVLLHAAYDFGLLYSAWYTALGAFLLAIGLNGSAFYLYGRAERRDRANGLSASSRENWYCPHCGKPNPRQHLHCPACGRRT